jgi:cytoskeleton protein RodZ
MNPPDTEPAAPAAAPPPPAPEAPPSPGALLRQARERAGLGADDLAGQLKLAKGTLEALERDDFAALSEPVYVRGYYRKIAKVLPIAESELINAYNARQKPAPSAPPVRLPLARGVAAGASRNARGPGIGLVIGGLVMVIVLVAMITREPPRRLAGTIAAPAPSVPAPAAPAAPVAEPAERPAAEPAQGETPAPAPAGAAAPPGVPNQLVLDFSEASYVRVDDSQGRTLKIGLVRGGERHALEGAPPYTVFLGNAQHVSVFLGGQPVDFSAHVNPEINTARFTVP